MELPCVWLTERRPARSRLSVEKLPSARARRAPLGVDVRRAGRRKRPKPAKTGPETAGTDAPEKRLGALRPGLRRQRGANWVPSARWGVRLASWHRASSARGFYLLLTKGSL